MKRDQIQREAARPVEGRDASRAWCAATSSTFQDRTDAVSRSQPATRASPGISAGAGPLAIRNAAPTSQRYTGGGPGATAGGGATVACTTGGVGSGGAR